MSSEGFFLTQMQDLLMPFRIEVMTGSHLHSSHIRIFSFSSKKWTKKKYLFTSHHITLRYTHMYVKIFSLKPTIKTWLIWRRRKRKDILHLSNTFFSSSIFSPPPKKFVLFHLNLVKLLGSLIFFLCVPSSVGWAVFDDMKRWTRQLCGVTKNFFKTSFTLGWWRPVTMQWETIIT